MGLLTCLRGVYVSFFYIIFLQVFHNNSKEKEGELWRLEAML
jgi:hypothetical protein